MAKGLPTELSGVLDGLQQSLADGALHDAAIRTKRCTFNATTLSTTTNDTLSLGKYRAGDRIKAFEIDTNGVNMSAASIAIGTAAAPDMFLAAAALPNATSARRVVRPGAAGYAPLEEEIEMIITISGATIPNGLLKVETEFTHR